MALRPLAPSTAATTVTALGPLTDTELRATAVPVSGPLTDTELRATAVPVTGPSTDAGPGFGTLTRTFTQNDDISTARDITAAPAAGQKIVAVDVLVSVDTAGYVTIQMETSNNVLAGLYMTATPSSAQITLRGLLKGDAADKKLQMKSSVASKGACTCVYYSEA